MLRPLFTSHEANLIPNLSQFYAVPPSPNDPLQAGKIVDSFEESAPVLQPQKLSRDRVQAPRPQKRPYQQRIFDGLKEDACTPRFPWLGIVSPMQTGKSHLTPDIIRDIGKDYDQIIVLTNSRIANDQLYSDLSTQFEEIGLLDEHHKSVEKITVASMHTLARKLGTYYPEDKKTLIIMDEAFSTQCATMRIILSYFNLGVGHLRHGRFYSPEHSNNLLIGYSGTAAGSTGYYVSGKYSLQEAIKDGWVRNLVGSQIKVSNHDIEAETRRQVSQKLVWWKPTKLNANSLANIYFDKIHGNHEKNLIYVPSIKHGELIEEALREVFEERYGMPPPNALFGFVHSSKPDEENNLEMEKWRQGGALISINKLKASFRGTGTGAIFHTYQTTSPELYTQRTGRGWGNPDDLPPLFIYEVSWTGDGFKQDQTQFMNLARLFGLVDYDFRTFDTRVPHPNLTPDSESEDLEVNSIRSQASFSGVPKLAKWRDDMVSLIGVRMAEILNKTIDSQLAPHLLLGFVQGSLPFRLLQVEKLARLVEKQNKDGKNALIQQWLDNWAKSFDSFGGQDKAIPFMVWKDSVYEDSSIGLYDKAVLLDALLASYYGFFTDNHLVYELSTYAYYHLIRSNNPDTPHQEKSYPVSEDLLLKAISGAITKRQFVSIVENLIRNYKEKVSSGYRFPNEDVNDEETDSEILLNFFLELGVEYQGLSIETGNDEKATPVVKYHLRLALTQKYGLKWRTSKILLDGKNTLRKTTQLYKWLVSDEPKNYSNKRFFQDVGALIDFLKPDYPAFNLPTNFICGKMVAERFGWDFSEAQTKIIDPTLHRRQLHAEIKDRLRFWVAAQYYGSIKGETIETTIKDVKVKYHFDNSKIDNWLRKPGYHDILNFYKTTRKEIMLLLNELVPYLHE